MKTAKQRSSPLDQELVEKLAARGFRFTPQREHVYSVLLEERDHPTAETVFIRAKHGMPDISSTMAIITQSGLAAQAIEAGILAVRQHFQRSAKIIAVGTKRQRYRVALDHLLKCLGVEIAGAFIEARSCERFARLAPHLDAELAHFYRSLLRSESRHFRDYLAAARKAADGADIGPRIDLFAERERQLIEAEDTQFRFHSGPPAAGATYPDMAEA